MQVHLLGVRGSTAATGAAFARVGGNTSCVALAQHGELPSLVIDGGTGIRNLHTLLGEEPFGGALLLSHLHWDHTQGIPFSRSLDHDGARVDVHLPDQRDGHRAVDVLRRAMSPPHFPIEPEGLRGAWNFHLLEEGTHTIGDWQVVAREIPHKGGRTFGYRVTDGRSVFAYLSDHGPSAMGPGPDGWGPYHDAALALAADADVLVHDAQHTAEELPAVARFGHSAMDYAVALAARANTKRVVLFHHDPNRDDSALEQIGERFACASVPVAIGRECDVFELG